MRIVPILRGIVTTALTWAVVWIPFSLIPFGLGALFGADLSLRLLGALVAGQAVTGAINGAVFAGLLAVVGRRRTFESLSLPWFAAWGAVGGALFPVAVRAALFATTDLPIPASALVSGLVTSALVGASCATLTLSIARRASQPVLPPSNPDAAPAINAGAA